MKMRDELGVLYSDSDWLTLFRSDCGQGAISPSQLALVTVMQFAEGLSDRQAADSVRGRIDWKYALGLELTDPGFDFSVLSEFRHRLIESGRSSQLLEQMLKCFRQDPQARNRTKRDVNWTGYTVHLTETCDPQNPHLITHVETTPAATGDVEMTGIVHQALANKDLLPGQHLVDTAYVSAEHLLTSQREYAIDLVGRVPSDTSWQAQAGQGFGLSDFHLDWAAEEATCPAGCSTDSWTYLTDRHGHGVIRVRFGSKDCRACSSRSLCTRSSNARVLTLHPKEHYEALQAARERQTTIEFKRLYAKRAGVEGTISQAVGAFGLRHSRYIGLAKTHVQHIATAAAINLSRFFDWCNARPRSQTRISRFAALQPLPS